MMMPRTTGYVDDNGEFRLRKVYKMKSGWDMDQLEEILEDPSAGAIKESYDDEKAVITVRSKW
jgi:hypothetical protein